MRRPGGYSSTRARTGDDASLARQVASAALEVPGVAGLSPGTEVEIATYGPGERVRGIRLHRGRTGVEVEVHLVARVGPGARSARSLPRLARDVRDAISGRVGEGAGVSAIHVAIDDCVETREGRS